MTAKSKITGTDVVVELATLEDVPEIMRWLKDSVYDDYPGEPGYMVTCFEISEAFREAMPYAEEYAKELIGNEDGESYFDIKEKILAYVFGFEKAMEVIKKKNSV